MDIRKRTDPLTLLGAVVSLFLVISNDPWWSIRGANGNNLLTMQVSPFYFHASATGLSTSAPFVEFLGPFTRILLILAFVALGMSSLTPSSWWRELVVYFSLSALIEVYFSFLLIYHAAETTLLGTYGIVPTYSGTSQIPALVVGLDLKTYTQPLVTASFTFPFYFGFVGLGLVGLSLVFDGLRGRKARLGQKGVGSIFTQDESSE